MIIRYANGKTLEGVILSRTEHTLRVAFSGFEDAAEFTQVSGRWITEDWEPVEFEPALRPRRHVPMSDPECICPRDLASRLIHLLLAGSDHDEPACALFSESTPSAAAHTRIN